MSKKRNRQIQVQPSQAKPQNLPDARHEIAARASKALRSAEITRFRQNLIQVYSEAINEQVRTHQRRPSPGKSIQNPTPRRQLPTPTELRRQGLPSQVRNQLQDGIRALACEERRTRKEVMFALRRTGKNGRGNKKAKWTSRSYLRCK